MSIGDERSQNEPEGQPEPWRLSTRRSPLQVSMRDTWNLDELEALEDLPDPRDSEPTASPEQVVAARVLDGVEMPLRRLPPRWVLISLAIHCLICLALLISQRLAPPLQKAPPENLAVYNVNAQDLPVDLQATLPTSQDQVQLPSTQPTARVKLPSGQFVNLAPPRTPQEAPETTRYLAADNHLEAKETRSRDFSVNPDVVASRMSKTMREEKEGGDKALSGGATTPRDQVAMVPRSSPDKTIERKLEEAVERGDIASGEQETSAENSPPQRKLNLFPNPGQVAALLGGGGPGDRGFRRGPGGERSGAPDNDALDVPEGDETRLNARKFAYEKFFNSIRRQFNYYYTQAGENLSARDIGQRVFDKTYVTVFKVSLRNDGSVDGVEVLHSSGVAAFDGLVTTALHQASPFTRVPPELLDDSGLLTLSGECRMGVGMGSPSFQPTSPYERAGRR